MVARHSTRPPVAALLLALAAPLLLGADPGRDGGEPAQITTMTFHERIIVRVPRLASPAIRPAPVGWKEKRGPRCIVPADLAGAILSSTDAIDLVLVGNRRLRARLGGGCEPLDFYSGVYLKPSKDGMICAGRDSIRARSGAACRIDTLRLLLPVLPKR